MMLLSFLKESVNVRYSKKTHFLINTVAKSTFSLCNCNGGWVGDWSTNGNIVMVDKTSIEVSATIFTSDQGYDMVKGLLLSY